MVPTLWCQLYGANSMVPIFVPTEDETMNKPDSCLGASRCCMHVTTYMIVQNLFCMIAPFVMLSCSICPMFRCMKHL